MGDGSKEELIEGKVDVEAGIVSGGGVEGEAAAAPVAAPEGDSAPETTSVAAQ